jgi:uncharacterized protein (DUF4415 family)
MRKKPSRPDAENPEWTEQDFREARPALELLPGDVVDAVRRYRGQRGPQKAPTKELISIRVDRDVVAAYRATGAGWQVRANEALRSFVMRDGRAPRGRRAFRALGGRTKRGQKIS